LKAGSYSKEFVNIVAGPSFQGNGDTPGSQVHFPACLQMLSLATGQKKVFKELPVK
jgi:hypothetical protein